MGWLGKSCAHLRQQRRVASAVEPRWKMDRLSFRARGGEGNWSTLDSGEGRRGGAKVHRCKGRDRRFCLGAGRKAHCPGGERCGSARGGEESEGEEDSTATCDRPLPVQTGHRRLSDGPLFAPAIAGPNEP